MSQSVLLPPGPFTQRQAQAVTTAYSNITLEDDQGSHFRLVVRDTEGRMLWRAWNFEPDAGEGLNRYIRTSGIHTGPPPADREAFTRNISPARTPFISPYASHRRWRFY